MSQVDRARRARERGDGRTWRERAEQAEAALAAAYAREEGLRRSVLDFVANVDQAYYDTRWYEMAHHALLDIEGRLAEAHHHAGLSAEGCKNMARFVKRALPDQGASDESQ